MYYQGRLEKGPGAYNSSGALLFSDKLRVILRNQHA